jgi:hypothetical protein
VSASIAQATTKVFEVLQPLPSEERLRVVEAALTLLGDRPLKLSGGHPPGAGAGAAQPRHDGTQVDGVALSSAAKAWVRKHAISTEVLQQYFDISDGKATLIGLPGNSKEKKSQALNTYLMTGLANYLATGDSSFSDDEARKLCIHFGCYDKGNHSKYLGDLGNQVTGSKGAGWRLTAPGLTAAAQLLKAKKGSE